MWLSVIDVDLLCQEIHALLLKRQSASAGLFPSHNYAAFVAGCACLARDFFADFFFAAPVCSKLLCKTETRSITLVGLGAFFGFSAISFPPASTFSSITSMSASQRS